MFERTFSDGAKTLTSSHVLGVHTTLKPVVISSKLIIGTVRFAGFITKEINLESRSCQSYSMHTHSAIDEHSGNQDHHR